MRVENNRLKLRLGKDVDTIIDVVCGMSIVMIMPVFYSINSFLNYGFRWALGGLFLLCVGRKDKGLFIRMLIILISGFIFTIIYMFNVRMVYGAGQASFITRSMLCWLYMIYALYYSIYRNNSNNQSLAKMFMLIVIITAITSIIGMHKYSYLAESNQTIVRTLGNGGVYSDESRKLINRSNIANWQLAYGFALSTTAFVWRCRGEKKWIYWGVTALIVVFLIDAQITFALIFSLIPIIYYFVKKGSKARQLITYLVLLLIGLILLVNISSIFYFLYETMEKMGMTMLGLRFYQLYEGTKIGRLVGTGAGRMEMYRISFSQFLENPILGYKLKSSSELYTKLGMHSQILDTLGGTGIVGFLFYFLPFGYIIKQFDKSFINSYDRNFTRLGVMILLLFMFTNPTTYACEVYMAVFCLPLWLKNSNEKK